MKTFKIGVEIHKHGDKNGNILQAVANHNEGKIVLSHHDIMGFLRLNRAMFPNLSSSQYTSTYDCINCILRISEDDGKTFTLTLTWKEVTELNETELSHIHSLTDKIS